MKALLKNLPQAREQFKVAWEESVFELNSGKQLVLEVRGVTRSLEQNQLMWSAAGDLSRQVKWFGKNLTPEGWVRFITAHLNGQELVPNMDGSGFVSLEKGKSTSTMTVKELTAVIELMHAFGAEQGAKWSPTSLGKQDFQ